MLYWLDSLTSHVFVTCDDAISARMPRRVGSAGTGLGFPIERMAPNISNIDHDDVVCEITPEERAAGQTAAGTAPSPASPEPTPTATATPAPARTPAACPTAAELRYLTALGESIDVVAANTVGERLQAFVTNPTDELAVAFLLEVIAMQVSAQAILDLDPPTNRLASIDNVASSMATKFIEGSDVMINAISEGDDEGIGRSTEILNDAVEEMWALNEELAKFCA